DIIVRAVDQITNRPCGTEWEESNKQLNTELLNGLLDLPDLLDIETYEVAPIADISQIMCIANVDVSVRPEILLKVTNKKAESIGALKFYLPKSYPLNQAAAEYVATIIHNFMEKNYQENTIDYRHCFVFDVPTGELYQAPRSFRRRRQEVLEACMEIADRWDRI
ncbi:MAG: hypothetical protein M0033_08105, partial [Nitrospiraceae bacterium]|nr:hypothetical protein [Nitrospiraceae bacterium]